VSEEKFKRQKTTSNSTPVKRNLFGIDIGTGASCIYPLLGVAMNNWNFIATDIDQDSLDYARKNISLNGWSDKIELVHIDDPSTILLFPRVTGLNEEKSEKEGQYVNSKKEGETNRETFDFCMCNPPFFSSLEEKSENPKAVCNATTGELVTEGGELAFIFKMIEDSLILRERITWYTSLIGRFVNVKLIKSELLKRGINNITTTVFYQGNTTRWAIAWSFSAPMSEARIRAKFIESMKDKQHLSFVFQTKIPKLESTVVLGTRLLETVDCIKSYAMSNGVKAQYNAKTFKMTLNIYDDSIWWNKIDSGGYVEPENEEDEESQSEGLNDITYDIATSTKCTPSSIGPMMPKLLAAFDLVISIQPNLDFALQFSKSCDYKESFVTLFYDLKELFMHFFDVEK
jgi:23S rRNA A1618 N6-methylase RlmF